MTERSLRASQITSRSKQCRICLDCNNPQTLVTPCLCRGSIEFVHQTCITQYIQHKFKNCSSVERRRMRQSIKCQICHSKMKELKIAPQQRCMKCQEACERVEMEDVVFIFVFVLLYIGFHTVGVILVIQPEPVSRVIGAFWLLMCVVLFNYGLYKIVAETCYVRQAAVKYTPRQSEEEEQAVGDIGEIGEVEE